LASQHSVQVTTPSGASLRKRLDSPWVLATVAAVVYAAYLLARLDNFGFEPSCFVCAGDQVCDPSAVPPNLVVAGDSPGYDGQHYYRLALDPLTAQRTAFGITFDSPAYRQQRILYPLLVWGLSWGQAGLVPVLLILLDYLAICIVAWLAGTLAQSMNQHALWGFLLAAYPGLLLSLARDLVEIVETALLLAGILLAGRRRHLAAALLFALAILGKETAAGLMVGAACLLSVHKWRGPNATDLRWYVPAVPLSAWAVWQLVLMLRWGQLPLLAGQANLGVPLAGIIGFLREFPGAADPYHKLWAGEMLFLAVFTVCVLLCMRGSVAGLYIKLGWFLYAGLASALSRSIWIEDWAFLRALTEFYVLGALIIIGSQFRGKALLSLYAAALWFVVMRTKLH
jgi:hypothetical protein